MIKDIFYSARPKYWAWLFVAVFLMMVSRCSHAALTDIKFGQSQIADSQWNVSACTQTTTCQIYSKNVGTMYKIPWTSGQWSWQPGQYVQFSLTGNATNPYEGKVYNSNGTLAGTIGTGHIVNMGADYFFFVGNDNNTGQLFSGSTGMSGSGGVSWTGTLNPTTAQADTLSNTYSTVPLTAGQTATQTPGSSGGGNQVAQNPRPTWPTINRASSAIGFGTGRTPYWRSSWCDNYWGCGNTFLTSYLNWNQGTGDGFHNYNYAYMRWPGTDNGVSKTIWFRTGYDDGHALYINGQQVTGGGCCYFAYGSYTAKPGEIVKLEFYSDNYGGWDYIAQVAWDPQGDGSYELLGSTTVGLESATAGGGSYWYSSDITTDQTNAVTAAKTRLSGMSLGNRIDLETKSGTSNPSVTIEQSGNYNLIQGLSGGNAIIDGDNNSINIKQGSVSGRNLIEFGVYGDSNTVTIWQARNNSTGAAKAPESGGHYTALGINGDSNTVTIKQNNDGGNVSGHFAFLYLTGNTNTITIAQANDNEKKVFATATGNSNTMSITQQGTGNHYLDISVNGNSNTASVTQKDSGTHKATVNLTNSGGASNLTLIQQGSTGQTYSIFQQCANAAGCSVSVTQQ